MIYVNSMEFVFCKSSLKGKSVEVLGQAQKLDCKVVQGEVPTETAKFQERFKLSAKDNKSRAFPLGS